MGSRESGGTAWAGRMAYPLRKARRKESSAPEMPWAAGHLQSLRGAMVTSWTPA